MASRKEQTEKYTKPGAAATGGGLAGARSGAAGASAEKRPPAKGHADESDYSEDLDWGDDGDDQARETKQHLENKQQLQQI